MTPTRHFDQSSKLKNVLYEIRGNTLVEAARLEAEGHRILKLNTGNPATFGFEAPHQIVHDMLAALPTAEAGLRRPQRLIQLAADGKDRVERRHRVLKHHRHLTAAQRGAGRPAEPQQLPSL